MTTNGFLQIGLYLIALVALAKPLGWYMARVYEGQPVWLNRLLGPGPLCTGNPFISEFYFLCKLMGDNIGRLFTVQADELL